MSQPLPGELAHFAPLLDRYGYAAVAGLVMAEGVGLPTPAVTILVAAAVYAGAGHLNLAALVAVAMLAASAGDNIGYGVGRVAGKPALVRWGRFVRLTTHRVHRVEEFFCHGGGALVPVARFVDGVRQTNGLIAGAIGMPWRRYAVLDALGAVLWTTAWTALGYTAGSHIGAVYATARHYEGYGLIVIAGLIAAIVGAHLLRRRRRRGRRREDAGASATVADPAPPPAGNRKQREHVA